MGGFFYRFATVKASFLVRRKINRKYLKSRANMSNARMTSRAVCPVYAAIAKWNVNIRRREARHRMVSALKHDPEKWKPVFRKDHASSRC